MPIPPKRIGLVRRFARWLTLCVPRNQHVHKGCIGWDHDDADYCCTHCECCPCWSWRCNHCFWERGFLRAASDWAWRGGE